MPSDGVAEYRAAGADEVNEFLCKICLIAANHHHELPKFLRLARVVFRGPGSELHYNRNKIQTFFRERINIAAFIVPIDRFCNDSLAFELSQPSGKNVRSDALIRPQKFPERTFSPERDITNDK